MRLSKLLILFALTFVCFEKQPFTKCINPEQVIAVIENGKWQDSSGYWKSSDIVIYTRGDMITLKGIDIKTVIKKLRNE